MKRWGRGGTGEGEGEGGGVFSKSDHKEYQDISGNFKYTVQDQGNIEADEMFVITDAVHGHIYCMCVDRPTQEQAAKTRNKFSKTSGIVSKTLTTRAFVF